MVRLLIARFNAGVVFLDLVVGAIVAFLLVALRARDFCIGESPMGVVGVGSRGKEEGREG